MFVAAIMLVAIALPMTPQINSASISERCRRSSIPTSGLLQQTVGVQNLKYATAMLRSPHSRVFYNNPMYADTTMSETSPWTWYFKYPLRGAATIALHTFNLTDQDLLSTYSRDLDPWYRCAWHRQPCRRGTGSRRAPSAWTTRSRLPTNRAGVMLTSCFWPYWARTGRSTPGPP